VRANLVALPFADGSVDAIVNLQTIEHLWDQDRFLRECARVLRGGGLLLLSTPNRRTFPPGNVFHSRELDARELVDLVRPHLDVMRVAGVGHGPRLRDWADRHGDVVSAALASAPAAWSDALSALVRSVSVDDFTVTDGAVSDIEAEIEADIEHDTELDRSLDLVVVAQRA
jgi:SAM-dependent methyltransferase